MSMVSFELGFVDFITRRMTMTQDVDVYETPAIVFEGDLEIQAGSPLGMPEDPFSLDDL